MVAECGVHLVPNVLTFNAALSCVFCLSRTLGLVWSRSAKIGCPAAYLGGNWIVSIPVGVAKGRTCTSKLRFMRWGEGGGVAGNLKFYFLTSCRTQRLTASEGSPSTSSLYPGVLFHSWANVVAWHLFTNLQGETAANLASG